MAPGDAFGTPRPKKIGYPLDASRSTVHIQSMTTRNEMVAWFKKCDAEAAIPMTASERSELERLRQIARTVGLGGPERGTWARLIAKEAEEKRRGL